MKFHIYIRIISALLLFCVHFGIVAALQAGAPWWWTIPAVIAWLALGIVSAPKLH